MTIKNKTQKYKVEELAIFLYYFTRNKLGGQLLYDDVSKKCQKEYLDLAKTIIKIINHE